MDFGPLGSPEETISTALARDEAGWSASAVSAWLATRGRLVSSPTALLEEFGRRMIAAGAPVLRVRFGLRTLHPEHRALSYSWTPAGGVYDHGKVTHGIEHRDAYIGSPAAAVYSKGVPFRRSLRKLDEANDHAVLHETAAAGGSDYFSCPLRFATPLPVPDSDSTMRPEIGGILAFVCDRASGFEDADLSKLGLLAALMAPIAEVVATRALARSLLDTYVGPRTGARILAGQVRRGDAETIDAAIWFSDLRDFTELSETLSGEELLESLNAYFELVAAAVTARGGEVLRFIGDAMLIVFPISSGGAAAVACECALDAAIDAFDSLATLNHRRRRTGRQPLRFGVGLHVGTVVYGNVGAPNRLDFTVMGPAVNRTARLESLTKQLLADDADHPVLMSDAFASRLDCPVRSLGHHPMKGVAAPPEVFALDEAG